MKFEARKIDIKLELKGSSGEERVFIPKDRVNADFSEKIINEMQTYIEAQKDIPESEQESILTANLKFLVWVYKDIDTTWVKNNFAPAEILSIRDWVLKELNGAKKDGES